MARRTTMRVCVVAALASALVVSCANFVDLEDVTYDADDSGAAYREDGAATPSHEAVPDVPQIGDAAASSAPATPAPILDAGACSVHQDGKLHCTNRKDAPLRALPKETSAIVNTLRTTSSYFLCWGVGERHAGGNTTWYYTAGDDNPNLGWTPGVMLNTPSTFDANPSAFGFRNCSR